VITYSIFDQFENLFAVSTTKAASITKIQGKNKHWIHYQKELFESLDIDFNRVCYLNQIHSNKVILVKEPGFQGRGDGMFTPERDPFLCVTTADCVPIYFYYPELTYIGIIHCGWRGAKKGIIKKASVILKNKIKSLNIKNVFCVVGPHINKCCYEFDKKDASCFDPKYLEDINESKVKLDLTSIIVDHLLTEGFVKTKIEISEQCTHCERELLYSFRRDKDLKGRIINIIGMKSN